MRLSSNLSLTRSYFGIYRGNSSCKIKDLFHRLYRCYGKLLFLEDDQIFLFSTDIIKHLFAINILTSPVQVCLYCPAKVLLLKSAANCRQQQQKQYLFIPKRNEMKQYIVLKLVTLKTRYTVNSNT